ncbi:MAG: hypothetical protein M3464_17725, partial [Chloroflexota bacterium]|nr:hypothetical protein [Chloroflexota bacterium]
MLATLTIEDAIAVLSPIPLAVVTHRARPTFRPLLVGCLLLSLAAILLAASPARGQTTIERADPPVEGTVAVSPRQIGVWFGEPLADDPGTIAIHLLSAAGTLHAVGPPSIYAVDPRHVSVPILNDLVPGSYSVLWTGRFAGDERERSGAYGFRVGATGEPGAATASDTFPAVWAIITRVLTLFGLALALGGLVAGSLGSTLLDTPASDQRRRLVILAGAVLALLATLAEPVFTNLLAVPSAPLPAVFSGYPATWRLRAAAVLALVAISAVWLVRTTSGRGRLAAWLTAAVLGVIALIATCTSGMALPSAASNPGAAIALVVVQTVIVVLVGMTVHLELFSPAAEPDATPAPPTRRTTPEVLLIPALLAAIALVATIVLGLLVLPGLAALIQGLFGPVLLVTALSLVAVLLLSIPRRRGLPPAGRRGLATLATLGLINATVMALLVPPSGAAVPASLAAVNIVDPVPLTVAGEPGLAHLQFQPARPGDNTFIVWLSTAAGLTAPERPDVAIELHSLSDDAPPVPATMLAAETDPFAIATASLPTAGWWQATVTVTPATGSAATADFFLLAPDPNVAGHGPRSPSSAAAEAVFDRGLATMTSLRHVQFTIALGGGGGTFANSEIAINDGGDGSTRGYRERATGYETVIVGDQQWVRFDNEDWSDRQAGYIYVPADWGATYERATGFILGPIVELGGEPSQVVTFWLPRQEQPRQEPAWFAWWVDTETGQVHRETMISNRHY